MRTWTTYFRATALTLVIGTAFVACYGIFNGTVGPSYVADIIDLFCTLAPLSVFSGGLAVAGATAQMSSRDRRRAIVLLCIVGAVSVFLLLAVIGPSIIGLLIPASAGSPPSANTVWESGATYYRLVAERSSGQPTLEWMVQVAGLYFYRPFVAAILAAILFLLGISIARRTSTVLDARRTTLQHLGAGAVILGMVTGMTSMVVSMVVDHAIAPEAALWVIPLPPVVMLVTLMWADGFVSG